MSTPLAESDDSDTEMQVPKPVLPFRIIDTGDTTTTGSTIPLTPQQYLSQVHLEAAQLPAILTAPTPPPPSTTTASSVLPLPSPMQIHKLPPTPTYAQPCEHWRAAIKQFFKRLQTGLMTIKPQPKKKFVTPSSSDQWLSHFANHMPTVTFGQHLDFLSTVAALNVLHETLPPSDSEEKETPTIALNLLSNSFIPLWIFGLLAFLPPPVDADTYALLNSLRSKFVVARSVVSIRLTDELIVFTGYT